MRAYEFLKENVLQFKPKDTRPDWMKHDDAVEDQTGNRGDLGVIPCPYCEDLWCNFDCDEAQAGGFDESAEKLKLPDMVVGDEIKVGKFKNRKAEIKGFKKDDKNHPILKTTKGDQKLFKPRISKLEPKQK